MRNHIIDFLVSRSKSFAEDMKGKGLGSRLMESIMDAARERGISTWALSAVLVLTMVLGPLGLLVYLLLRTQFRRVRWGVVPG